MRRTIVLLLASIVASLAWAHPSQAEKRVALVVGNSSYKHIPSLDNPERDARLIAETLGGLGFTLIGGRAQLDLDKAALDQAVQSFGSEIQGADVALFYYAGHGVQVRGNNYLLPVGANPAREADVDFQMLDANLVLRQMEGSGSRLNLLILDACRNNPLGGRGLRTAASGLAQMQAPEGTLISFATQPGNVALDGSGDNSPFTQALAEVIRKPGLDIFRTFNEVGLAVTRATGGQQKPWVSLSPITGEFYFAGREIGAEPKQNTGSATAASPAAASDPALAAWNAAKDSDSVSVIEAFIARFGDSFYAELAKARLAELKKKAEETKVAVGVFPKPERGYKPGDSFKDCDDCPEMVVVPAGTFTMGSPPGETPLSDERPQHRVTISAPFAVGKFEVTFDEWDACVANGGCDGFKPPDKGEGRGKRPVINVSWDDAKAYTAWLSKKTAKTYRLLSEAEWEYAARAGSQTRFSFGNDDAVLCAHGNHSDRDWPLSQRNSSCSDGAIYTAVVGGYKPNSFGLYDMHGNVSEWVEDCPHDGYDGAPSDGSAWTTGCTFRYKDFRVTRGGSFADEPSRVRSAHRHIGLGRDIGTYGLRVARTLD
jgi:formylglycine-generating enzyme required for sulfatase activity